MMYLNTKHINEMGVNWEETINVISKAVQSLDAEDFLSQLSHTYVLMIRLIELLLCQLILEENLRFQESNG